ncbi:hypothetical protein H4Q26_016734 [Puccinia striiformis f. sp. tritici PST-130]|uniref:Uncharacterized protein n=1 Tax=Puccinia striiformis f. sp. tritici PST-78 TaxID=1165861 RepID=A0A0L0W203_9BASI|nr:hypothetical protein H4Q26_016734 [Puccinia striiformis f. sp. tritici PST-130]KNF05534.1 hypothetical protein PSTG_01345 [Puccinia striiformis f. sp. tritici PST-78]
MKHVRNPAGSVVGRTANTKRGQSLHDPFRDPPFTHFIKSSTFWKTWPSVLLFTLEAAIIAFSNRNSKALSVSTTILTVLGTVIGFAISYRTSSAYTQYIEARKAWGNVIHHSRTLSRLIWIHLPNELTTHTSKDPATEEEKLRAMLEKKTMVNLVQAFSVSLKHYLRGEYGIYYEDLYHLTCMLPKYNQVGPKSFTGVPQLPSKFKSQDSSFVVEVEKAYSIGSEDEVSRPKSIFQDPTIQPADPMNPPIKLLPEHNPPRKTVYDRFPFLRMIRTFFKGSMNATGLRQASDRRYCPEENIPLEILWHLSIYLATLQARKVIDVPTTNTINASLVGLSDALANVERVLTTPIPFGYLVHLKTIIWGYLTFLPFQLIGTFRKITIPATGLIAFAFLGFLQIGEDIENPFGYSSNDLDLDHFCSDIISRELGELTSTPPTDPMSFVLTSSNMPLFERGCFQTASEMSNSLIKEDLEHLLSEPMRMKNEEGLASFKNGGKPTTTVKTQNNN